MSPRQSAALVRALKVAAAGALAGLTAWVAGPDLANVVGTQDAVILAAVLTPIFSGIEKAWSLPAA